MEGDGTRRDANPGVLISADPFGHLGMSGWLDREARDPSGGPIGVNPRGLLRFQDRLVTSRQDVHADREP